MTPRQQRFVDEYLRTGSVSAAGKASGIEMSLAPPASGSYVYMLIDTHDDEVLYVGKGVRRRMFSHLSEFRNCRVSGAKKYRWMAEAYEMGHQIVPAVFCAGLTDTQAIVIEREVIQAIGVDRLANSSWGFRIPDEGTLVRCEDLIHRVKPFCLWLAESRRTVEDINLRVFVYNGLRSIRNEIKNNHRKSGVTCPA